MSKEDIRSILFTVEKLYIAQYRLLEQRIKKEKSWLWSRNQQLDELVDARNNMVENMKIACQEVADYINNMPVGTRVNLTEMIENQIKKKFP